MLGSQAEAEDAVQEAWLRAQRAGTSDVSNLGGWLTTVVSRVCLDMLRSRKSRREDTIDRPASEPVERIDPESEAVLADSVGMAMMVVLDTLAPAERVAFVLHDLFDVPFDQIAAIVGRSEPATRQLASRARRRVRGQEPAETGTSRRDDLVRAFLAASREGRFEDLLKLLDPSVVMRADASVIALGTVPIVSGAEPAAKTFAGWGMRGALPALVGGTPGLVWIEHNQVRVAFAFTFHGDRIAAIDLIGDAAHVKELAIELR